MSEKIIIGVDGSQESRVALDWGLARAMERQATVELVHAVDDSFLSDRVAFLSEAQNIANQVLDAEVEHARSLGFSGEIAGTAVVGHPVSVIEELSKAAALVVLGAHMGSKFAATIIGTRAGKIAAVSYAPVAVIPDTRPSPNAPIVAGIDGSQASKEAIAFAAEEASRRRRRLVAVEGWSVPIVPGIGFEWSEEFFESERQLAEETLAIDAAGLAQRYPDLEVERRAVEGAPVAALIDAAQGAELLVVGRSGRGSISRLLLGSVSQGVLHALPCPVVITRS